MGKSSEPVPCRNRKGYAEKRMLHNSTYAGKLKDSGDLIGIYVDKMQHTKKTICMECGSISLSKI